MNNQYANFKKVFAHLLCGYTASKNLIIDMAKQEGNVLLLHILICPGHYSFVFLMQISSNLPILICFTNAVHAAAFSSADTCLSDSTFPLYLLNRT